MNKLEFLGIVARYTAKGGNTDTSIIKNEILLLIDCVKAVSKTIVEIESTTLFNYKSFF